jgi:acetyl-CoA acyltransferase
MLGREVVIVEAVRSAIGRGHPEKGVFRDTHAADLLGGCYRNVIERSGIDPALVEDVIAGCVQPLGEQSFGVARTAWLQEGFPVEAAATVIERQCGSAQQAVNFAAALVAVGVNDVVLGSGVEHMGHVPIDASKKIQEIYGQAWTEKLFEHHAIVGQGLGAELIADEYGITRQAMDDLAVRSHRLASSAAQAGEFIREIVVVGGVAHDQGIRPGTSTETLAQLKPVFKPDGRVTAGSSSQISDGASAVLIMSRDRADDLGLRPRARIVDQIAVGCDPVKMLEGPIPVTEKLLRRNRMTIGDIDRFEVNEAFAPVVLAWQQTVGADPDRVNVRGGAIALGHPLGSTGARLITTLLHILEDQDKEIGLVAMCCGGGLGTGTLIQRI